LIAGAVVQTGLILWRLSYLPKSALSGVLAALLLVAATVSVSHTLHSNLHRDVTGSDDCCLACSFVKGQVSVSAVVLISAVLVVCCFWVVSPAHTTPCCGFDYRISPSRAPPQP
jgi:flagellin-like protein